MAEYQVGSGMRAAGGPAHGKAWPFVVGIVVLLIADALFWYLRPMPRTRELDLIAPEALAILNLRLDPKGGLVTDALAAVRARVDGMSIPGILKPIVKGVAPRLVPTEITASVLPGDGPTDPVIMISVRAGRPLRLASLAPRLVSRALYGDLAVRREKAGRYRARTTVSGAGRGGLSAWAIVEGSLLISTSAPRLLEALARYGTAEPERTPWATEIGFLSETPSDTLRLAMLNSGGGLTDLFTAVETKFAFAAFPSIASVATVRLDVTLDPKESKGTARFSCLKEAALDKVESDVRFLYGAIRRVLKAQEISLKGSTSTSPGVVELDFVIADILAPLRAADSGSEGGKR